jgi:hypothetical protein
MRVTAIAGLACLIWLLNLSLSEARFFRPWLPDELEPQATLICNGTVLSTESTNVTKDFIYPNINPSSHHEIMMLAKIKVLHVFKGDAPEEIALSYRSNTDEPEIDGAMHIMLQKGQRYRFFLKAGPAPGQYVGVLDGNFDDNFAVEKLWPNEHDDSPYLRKDDAIKIARDYAASQRIDVKPDCSRIDVFCQPGDVDGASWIVTFLDPIGQSHGGLGVTVRGDRTVDVKQTRLEK